MNASFKARQNFLGQNKEYYILMDSLQKIIYHKHFKNISSNLKINQWILILILLFILKRIARLDNIYNQN